MPAAAGLLAVCVAVSVYAAVASGFAIDKSHTFLGYLSFHGTEATGGVHEQITAKAIRRGMPAAPGRLVAQIQAGAENVDVTHHFDAEYHFDAVSTSAFPERLEAAFRQLSSHLNGARPLADRNPEFFRPSFGSYRAIVSELPAALRHLAGDSGCRTCDRARLLRLATTFDAAENTRLARALAVNPNPDPHPPTNPESAFGTVSKVSCGLCGKLAGVRTEYLTLMTRVNRAVAFAIGQSSRLKRSSPVRRRLQRISDELRAYRAFQALGHAFHSGQDFFAHSNYVELMAGVEVEQPIRKGTKIPVPQRRADFGTKGLRAIMGAQRYARLESGSAAAIWLGEGDYCLGSPYNPDTKFTLRIPALIADTLGVPRLLSTPRIGRNPRPPTGLNYCHYPSKTVGGVRTAGLNKDEPGNKEPSHVNHPYARQAAEDMTAVLWKSFLATIEKPAAQNDSANEREPKPKPPGSGDEWILVKIEPNPAKSTQPPHASGVARNGHIDYDWPGAPQAEFDVDFNPPPMRVKPGGKITFTITVTGKLTGDKTVQGFRTGDAILLVNDRWDGRSAVGTGVNCVDPIGAAPISCTELKPGKGTLTATAATFGDTFSVGIGMLNCGPCYIRYTYAAR